MNFRRLQFGALALCLCLTTAAHAEPDRKQRSAARDLAKQARKAARSGDHQKAAELYGRAHRLFPAPTITVRHARELVALGRFVEAEEAYLETTRAVIVEGSRTRRSYQAAADVARVELAELSPRIPRLEIVIVGVPSDRVQVTDNGKPVPSALIGVARKVDPGEHVIVARLGDSEAKGTSTLKEGATETIELTLEAPAEVEAAVAPPAPAATPTKSTPPKRAGTDFQADAGSTDQKTWAYVAAGVGGLGLIAGGVTGLLAAGKHSDAEASCPGGSCAAGSDGEDDLDAFRSLRTFSTVGYVVGVLGLGAGVTLYLTADSDPTPVALRVGPGRLQLGGRF